ncbi:MAG TPA: hypothetical protein VEL28_11495 [Candidatus Binatia bacterium]|nr:hypothetical protein [Candidatus Binatia bacterium]
MLEAEPPMRALDLPAAQVPQLPIPTPVIGQPPAPGRLPQRVCVQTVFVEVYVDPDGEAALVRYTMDVLGSYEEVVRRVDPTRWDDFPKSAFKDARYVGPVTALSTPNPHVIAERRLLVERFDLSYDAIPNSRVVFHNVLEIDVRHEDSSDDGILDAYRMEYRLLQPAGAEYAQIPVPNGAETTTLAADQGFISVRDANGIAGELIETSRFAACKLLVLPADVVAAIRERQGIPMEGLRVSLVALVEATVDAISDDFGCADVEVIPTIFVVDKQHFLHLCDIPQAPRG